MSYARAAGTAFLLVLFFLSLLLPGIVNRHPILFPDSVGYYHSGEAVLAQIDKLLAPRPPVSPPVLSTPSPSRTPETAKPISNDLEGRGADGISTARSPFYGFLFALLYTIGGPWALPVLQILATATAMLLAMRQMGESRFDRQLAIGCATAVLGGLGIFAVTLMPDVFTGLLLLALAILLARFRNMGNAERIFWMALVLAACLFHKAHVAVALVIIGLFGLAALLFDRTRLKAVILPSLMVAIAVFSHLGVDLSVRFLTGRPPSNVPFVLARMVGDGTAEEYLRANCPTRDGALCAYLHKMPMTTDEFLWSKNRSRGVWQLASPEEKDAILAHGNEVVRGTILEYPLKQVAASTRNFVEQLFDVGVTEFGNVANLEPEETPGMASLLHDYTDSAIGRGELPLRAISAAMFATYAAAAAIIALLLWRGRERESNDMVAIIVLLVAGLVVNAAVSGVIAGVYDRYQGRVAWLSLFMALILISRRFGGRDGARRA